jgi:hypothetical protein
MRDFKLDSNIKQKCWEYINQNSLCERRHAPGTSGNKVEQYTGLVGEVMTKKIFGVAHSFKQNGFDGGFDFVHKDKKIDVKTMGRNVDVKSSYVNNFISLQEHFDCDVYIFNSINKRKNKLTICGYVSKSELMEKAKLYKKGSVRTRDDGTSFKMKADTYEISNSDLRPISDLLG